ncbi:hypothetical protein TPHA_0H01790 [Tetrapisispora phaffii CBS 4417]|uniref:TLDc domain-containing protein n=1 Tax=Tetrapisispora phaffii (strain ATCC 24235 / CBS 4417 / NBRC 1672 / NRRL Y-8282 / UCD 70-5) TaxID=1071381 RepID=G8BX81_TETPH|nr:hypothetical protein TPHA_0H01790 [Tetrapisispora phaffii CBS 4417]CCE64385.1 hypothetical protein TPHA_0H01790 [Tetrapisispora phaffii CBS 4417]
MGQGSSIPEASSGDSNESIKDLTSELEIVDYFNKRVISQFSNIELLCFKHLLEIDDYSTIIDDAVVYKLLQIQDVSDRLRNLILNFIKRLTNFPFISTVADNVTAYGLLKTIVILQKQKFIKYTNNNQLNMLKILFIALGDYDREEDNKKILDCHNISISTILTTYDGIPIHDISVSSSNMISFLTWILALSNVCPTNNSIVDTKHMFKYWEKYETSAISLVRSMNPDIIKPDDNQNILFIQFKTALETIMPHVYLPLEHLLNHLLFMESSLIKSQEIEISFQESKLMTFAVASQLSTLLRNDVVISKLHKLYSGRESGFSMRSFQSKAFKWNAPTILLISGMRVTDDVEYATKKNPRYKKFIDQYPRLRDLDQNLEPCHSKLRKVTFAVYVDEPWKVSNKLQFGGLKTLIVELSPRQDCFRAAKPGVIYFNTVGGGIGIGSSQPVQKKNSLSYTPGNVSLTIDNSLEFGAFRHTGYGGSIEPSSILQKKEDATRTFEIRFLIQDIEVWGCGGEKEIDEQLKQWAWEEEEAKKRQRVNLKSMGEDRALLEMAGIIGNHAHSGGSL